MSINRKRDKKGHFCPKMPNVSVEKIARGYYKKFGYRLDERYMRKQS